MENQIPLDKLTTIENIIKDLPKTPIVEVEFPSKGRFYNLIDSQKPVTLRSIDWTDEQAILSAKKGSNALNILLSRTLDNINYKDLLLVDKLAVLIKLREISISDSYVAVVTCPHCQKKSEVEQKLSELPIKTIPDKITDPVSFILPSLNKTAKLKLGRIRDEEYLSPNLIFTNLWRFVEEIDGVSDVVVKSEVIKKLPLKDIKTIIRFLTLQDYGVELKFNFICSECQGESVMEMPIGEDFFTEN